MISFAAFAMLFVAALILAGAMLAAVVFNAPA